MENNFEGKPGDLRFEIYEVKHFVGFGNVWNSVGGFCGIWCLRQGRWSGEVATSEEPEARRVLQSQQLAKSAIGGGISVGARDFSPDETRHDFRN